MEESALNQKPKHHKTQVLVTDAGSYLGSALIDSLLLQNCTVFGVGNSHLLSPFLSKEDFTLLEFDVGQPLPSYLPQFDIIFHLDKTGESKDSFLGSYHVSPATRSLVSQAELGRSHVILISPLSVGADSFEYLAKNENTKSNLRLFLVGDIYGPKMPLSSSHLGPVQLGLASLITQAVTTDKVILQDEGLKMVYPTYISDAIFAINKFAFSLKNKDVQIIVSEEPASTLSIAYEVQNVASLIGEKQLGLFFAGPPIENKIAAAPLFHISQLGFTPKVKLDEGLKFTFEYFKEYKLFSVSEESSKRSTHEIYQNLVSQQVQGRVDEERSFSQKLRINRGIITAKIPKFTLRLRFRNLVILFLLILALSILKTSIDVYMGVDRLNKAKKALFLGDFDRAKDKAKGAENSFKAAGSKFKILSYPLFLIVPQKVNSTKQALLGAQLGSQSLFYFSQGAKLLASDFAFVTSQKTALDGLDLETPSADFKQALFFSSKVQAVAVEAKQLAIFRPRIESMIDAFAELNSLSSSALEITNLLNDFTGGGGQKTYLVLLQNNSELRPGGGFIGNFGTIEFDGGKLKAINVDDIYTIDGQLKEKIEPPKQLKEKLGISDFYLRDSNWSADFSLNAAIARDFFKKETGKNVDGVVAIDLTFIQNVLKKTGPIKLDDYNEEISSENLFERGEYWSEVGFFPGSTQKRDFFGALSRKLINQILESISQVAVSETKKQQTSPLVGIVQVVKESLSQKHIMVSFNNPTLSAYAATHGWDSPLPPRRFNPADDTVETRDFVAISEANIGANKVNRFINRKIRYEMTIGRDADLVAKLTISYTNNSQAETWPAGKYVNFLRIYVPVGGDLLEVKNGDTSDLKSVEVTTSGSLSTFATFVEVPVRSSRQISFTYRIPKNIKLESAPTYHLYVQKQAGTEKDPFEFTFNLPAYLAVKSINQDQKLSGSQNITTATDLSTDRQFEIEITKK